MGTIPPGEGLQIQSQPPDPPSSAGVAAPSGAGVVGREDLIQALLATLLVLGLFLDGWNHLNLQAGALGDFFTPWHGILYAGFTATALWVVSRNRHLVDRSVVPDPHLYQLAGFKLRYPFAVIGLIVATGGLAGDVMCQMRFRARNHVTGRVTSCVRTHDLHRWAAGDTDTVSPLFSPAKTLEGAFDARADKKIYHMAAVASEADTVQVRLDRSVGLEPIRGGVASENGHSVFEPKETLSPGAIGKFAEPRVRSGR